MPYHLLACRPCWFRLPAHLRNAFRRPSGNRLTAVAAALDWYRENVRGGAPL